MMTAAWIRSICLAWLCLIPFSGNAVTPMISAGSNDSLFLHSDGSVWGTGGITNYSPGATSPVRLLQLPDVIAVAATSFTGSDLALLADGTLWGSGNGRLVDGTTQILRQPKPVAGLSGIKAISAGEYVLALKEDGTVWSWGKNDHGQLGDGTMTDRYVPAQVSSLTHITKIAGSSESSLALRSDGTVWVWGHTCCGAAGNGLFPANDLDPEMHHLVPTQVLGLDQVTGIAAGGGHHLALREDGTVWTWGAGNSGQNGMGNFDSYTLPVRIPNLDHIVAIEARGGLSSLALRSDGTVWAWGSNGMGQLGTSGIAYSTTPTQVPGLSDIAAISFGFGHVLAMRRDGGVLAWGANGMAQLGDGTLKDHADPRPVLGPGGSGQINLVQPSPASVNQLPSGQIRLSAESGTAPFTVQASVIDASDSDGTITAYYWTSSDGQQLSGASASFVFSQAGSYQIILLIEDNAGGRGSAGRMVVVAPAANLAVSATPKVGVGTQSGMALTNDGRILTWGANGGLGLYNSSLQGTLPRANSFPMANGISGAIDVVLGNPSPHAHALLADGTVLSWGGNEFGEAGVGSLLNLNQPKQVSGLPPAKALAAGGAHTLALTRDGRVFAWGGNVQGELGVGDANNRLQPAEVTGLSDATAVVAGYGFSAVLKSDGTVWAWGANDNHQLGDGTRVARNRPIQVPGLSNIAKLFATANGIFAQKGDGTIWVTGRLPVDIAGDPGPASGPRHVVAYDGAVQIAGDQDGHAIVLKAGGTVWTGGRQSSFALGFQNSGDIAGLKQLPGISDAIGVAAGYRASMIVRRDGTVLSWGINSMGRLGNGTLAALQMIPALVFNESADGFLDLIPEVANTLSPGMVPPYFVATVQKDRNDLSSALTDSRAQQLVGSVYFTGLLPRDSPLLTAPNGFSSNAFAADAGMVPVSFGRGGIKQTGPVVTAESNFTGTLNSGNSFAVWGPVASDPLANSNAIICIGVTVDALSAKGQVLMRPIATGDQVQGVVQCPTVQTASTAQSYTAAASGALNKRTITAQILPQPEDRGQARNIYSWAVAPNGTQLMQTANGWALMTEPMQPAMTLTVPASGLITLPVTNGLDLTTLAGTLVYIGIGSSWQEVSQFNKAGHYYTVQ